MEKNIKKYNTFPKKNYLIVILVIVFIILLGIYLFKWGQVKEDVKYLNSYLVSTGTISLTMNNINEIESVLSETPNSYFVYISYTKDENIYNFEKELKPIIDEYHLQNNFYFMNVTNIKDKNQNYKEDIETKLKIKKGTIEKIPAILYFKDGKLESEKVIYTKEDFKELLNTRDN